MSRVLPSEWASVHVRDLAKIVYGRALLAGSRVESGDAIVYGSGGIVGRHNESLHKGPSIVIGRKGNVGAVYYVNQPFWCIDTAFYLNNISGIVDLEFLAYSLQVADLAQYTKSVAVPGISREDIENTVISLPPLSEQRRITAILREADEIRKLRKQANEKTQGIVQALFYDMFGDPVYNDRRWPAKKIKNICTLVRGSSPRPQGDRRYFRGSIPRLMIADITRDGSYVTPQIDSLTEEGAKASRYMSAGSVVMAVSGAPGLPAMLNIDACIHDGFVGFRDLSNELDPGFFLSFLLAIREKNNTQAIGATFQNLTTDQINNWSVLFPPIPLQHQYTKLVSQLRHSEEAIKTSTAHLNALYQSLLTRAFTGELTATRRRDYNLIASGQAIGLAAEERDRLLGGLQRSKPVVSEMEAASIALPEVLITDERSTVIETLSPLQGVLYNLMQKRKDTYFAATKLHSDIQTSIDEYNQYHVEQDTERHYQDFAGLNCSLDTLRRELHALATMGLAREAALPVEDEDEPGTIRYVTVYRFLQVDDDCQQEDLAIINHETAQEVLI